jgi:hypothetical protein
MVSGLNAACAAYTITQNFLGCFGPAEAGPLLQGFVLPMGERVFQRGGWRDLGLNAAGAAYAGFRDFLGALCGG